MTSPVDTNNKTARRLIELIVEHAVNSPGKKLRKAELAKAAGITRQALHRFYSHLGPYITGEKPVSELLGDSSDNQVLSTGLERIKDLEGEIAALKSDMEERISKVKADHITALMKSDLALHDIDGLRARLESQSIHNDILVKKIRGLEAALTTAKLDAIEVSKSTKSKIQSDIVAFDIAVSKAFEQFRESSDKAQLDNAKTKAVREAVVRAWDKLRGAAPIVVLFIDRYLCSFEKFCNRFGYERNGRFAVIRAPIFSFLQLKTLVLSKLDPSARVIIVVPFCDSPSVSKAQRSFYFSHVPEHEFELADKMATSSITDPRINEVVMFRVNQGD
jgi:hypothetical protein